MTMNMSGLELNPYEQLKLAMGELETISIPQTKADPEGVVRAMSSVLNYIITDSFRLAEEESIWVSYALGEILNPLKVLRPRVLLAAVKQELNDSLYTDKMIERDWDNTEPISGHGKQAKISEWAEMLSEIILVSYPDLRGFITASIVGTVYGILDELGLSEDTENSRQSAYLPNAIRQMTGLDQIV